MKKLPISFVLMLLLLFTVPAQAADSLYRMLHADEVESFREDQDAIVLVQVRNVLENHLTADVLYILSGEVEGNEINIHKDIRFLGRTGKIVQLGDYYVISVKKYGDFYKQAWAALQADSGDYHTLKFYYDSHFSDIDALQWYVNSGGVEKDFFFEETKAFVRQLDGTALEITLPRTPYLPEEDPVPETMELSTESTSMDNKEAMNMGTEGTVTPKPSVVTLWMSGIMLLMVTVVFFIGRQYWKK